ncbi:DUF6892 domain-containing protein [Clostridium saccharoperbutylacetonicum]|uniref:DUF6892 domain-containing protein n=1 Tax=Clostridium saccharoperbutylacetonicum TaxID=36745 RepID=UPI0039EA10AA
MKRYIDKTRLFDDFNFKLIVINSLLEQNPSFEAELEKNKELYTDKYEWYSNAGPIEEMLEFFEELSLTQQDLDKITDLYFDGGNDIYGLIIPDWDGEDDFFDVHSVHGFENLPNLETVELISMCDEEVLEPMREKGISIE